MSLSLNQLRVSYPGFALIVDQLRVVPGSVTAIVGRSGSGKSTLLQAIAGFVPCVSGEVVNAGVVISDLPPEKRKTAVVFQRGALFPHLSVQANVEFGLRCQGVSRGLRKQQSEQWLSRVGLYEMAQRFPHQLSGGQAQRVALARAFAVGFPTLLLDEPFSALDRELREQLGPELKSLVREAQVSALLVTHDPADVLVCADQILVLEAGRVVEYGAVESVRTSPQSAYAGAFFG